MSYRVALVPLTLLIAVAGCSGTGDRTAGDQLDVLASFYPLQFVTAEVAGERATVASLTPPGAEPHDLELTAQDVGRLSDADLVVFLGGFQPAVDDAVTQAEGVDSLDVAGPARLDLPGDPHFWLDPLRLADVGDAVAGRLAEADPAGASTYEENAATLRTELAELDAEFETGLAECTSRHLVTSHAAFGYLARRYGLTQVGITGLNPDSEPEPRVLATVVDYVKEYQVRTVFAETLLSPAIARTVAEETGARVAVLDPLEGLTPDSAGLDYPAVLRANLAVLRTGLECR